ncbi:DUF309 domain-containing protein [Paenibacillus antri]|uniref:DUF309 domain-containing protein n=1 Tax=Paenibacillus antri TaxID=2582848 RepID=A0A5R9GJW9_9BACL|nr:DUF309 domain-containing protein [Paenibacillus antri]TLS53213.1 DUF309 domain-containing protein [Paenibacillus antri]
MRSAYPEAYVRFLAHYQGDRDFFECHELLEEYWKEHPDSPYRDAWVGLIQAAVGMYHYRRGNTAGAVKSFEGSLRRSSPERLGALGIDAELWLERLTETLRAARAGEPYKDVDLPVADAALEAEARAACEALGAKWGDPSRMEDPELLHRHARRDRSGVIEARRQAYEARRAGR